MKSLKLPCLTLLGVICAPLQTGHAQQPREHTLPADVRAFVERRDACDHFRGEDSPDPERAAQIARELERYCQGTDAELARLKRVHARDGDVRKSLDEYEIRIESATP